MNPHTLNFLLEEGDFKFELWFIATVFLFPARCWGFKSELLLRKVAKHGCEYSYNHFGWSREEANKFNQNFQPQIIEQ